MTSVQTNLPAEWATQDAVLLAWPHAQSDWLPFLPRIEQVYRDLVFHITRFEHVVLLCNTSELVAHVRPQLVERGVNLDRVRILNIEYNDTWLRDSGPITVSKSGQLSVCDFRFNGWGGKFDAALDDQICRAISQYDLFQAQYLRYEIFLEGGSIESDGAGTLMTTTQCLLTDTRNPAMSVADYEVFFAKEFGTERVFWLRHGELQGDDTDGHIDMLARFCDSETIAYTQCERQDDVHYASLSALEQELQALRTAKGQPYKLIPLPLPEPIYSAEGQRLPASYANFLIINDAVLVPIYDDANDERVLRRLQACFPRREVIGIQARAIIEQYGSLHCLTMQLPRGVLRLSEEVR
ncbi:MAG: agmatine deiminase [Gammaproteobacteria bacterium]|nr:agmatine deiminase [Gammaproteobacteria bacterium]